MHMLPPTITPLVEGDTPMKDNPSPPVWVHVAPDFEATLGKYIRQHLCKEDHATPHEMWSRSE